MTLLVVAACGGDDDSAASGAGSGAPAQAGSSATCQQVFDNAAAQCPESPWPPVAECEDDAAELVSIGCEAWNAWLLCASKAKFTCDGLFAQCDAQWQGAQQCRAMQAASGCIRVTGVDRNCSEPTPFAFGCLSGTPNEGCVPLMTAAAVPYFCCPK